jgi:Domain of unknown function (DUF1707)
MTGSQDPAAGGGQLRAGHADRELVIEALKDAFVQGRLTRDELGARAGRALAARTGAELAALTADIPAGPTAAGPVRPPTPMRRWPLVKAAAGSGGCLVFAFAAAWVGGHTDHPLGPSPYKSWMGPCFLVAIVAVIAALGILIHGVGTSIEQRRSSRQLPPRPGPGNHALDDGQRGSAGYGPVPPGPSADQAHTDLRAHKSQRRRRHVSARRPGHSVA